MKDHFIKFLALATIGFGIVSCQTIIPTKTAPLETVTQLPITVFTPEPTSSPTPHINSINSLTYPSPTVTTFPSIPLPHISSDLLFAKGDELIFWNHTTGKLKILAKDQTNLYQTDFGFVSKSPDNQKTEFFNRKTPQEFELISLDLYTNQLRSSMLPIDARGLIQGPTISPDGKWVAYISAGALPKSSKGNTPQPVSYPSSSLGGGFGFGEIIAFQLDQPASKIEVGLCSERTKPGPRRCMGFLWSPDSRVILWSDADGVWLAQPGQNPKMLVPYTIGVSPYVGESTVELRSWSPLGRYVLAGIGHPTGWILGIVDTQNGHVVEIPSMLEGAGWKPSMIWMHDGRLFSLKPGNFGKGIRPTGQIWRIDPGNDLAVKLDQEFIIDVPPDNYPTAPIQLIDHRLAFALLSTTLSNNDARGLYTVEPNRFVLSKVSSLPPAGLSKDYEIPAIDEVNFAVSIDWSPDGSGVIYQDGNQATVLYIPTTENRSYDLNLSLGEGECCFQWSKLK